jgi:hypothetical protein
MIHGSSQRYASQHKIISPPPHPLCFNILSLLLSFFRSAVINTGICLFDSAFPLRNFNASKYRVLLTQTDPAAYRSGNYGRTIITLCRCHHWHASPTFALRDPTVSKTSGHPECIDSRASP